jgi:cell division protein FtsL
MAVYEGARPRTVALPRRPRLAERSAPALPRRRARTAARARRGPNRLALVLGGIVVAFMLAFFSLAQQVQVSATTYDIGRLQIQKERLESQLQELRSDLNRLGREPAVRKLALDGGLGQLAEPIVLPAR